MLLLDTRRSLLLLSILFYIKASFNSAEVHYSRTVIITLSLAFLYSWKHWSEVVCDHLSISINHHVSCGNNRYWLKQENSKEREHALFGLNHIFDQYISQFLHIMQNLGQS